MLWNKDKKVVNNVSVGQILGQFWHGISVARWSFFVSIILVLAVQIVRIFIPLFYKKFFDILGGSTNVAADVAALTQIIFVVLIIHMADWTVMRVAIFIFETMEAKVIAKLKQNSFNYMIGHSHSFFANSFTGSLVQKVNRFSRAFESLVDSLTFNLIPLIVIMVGSIWVTWTVFPTVAYILIIWVMLITAASITYSSWKLKYDKAVAESDSKTTGYLADAITNNNPVSFFTGHNYEMSGFKNVSEDQVRKTLISWRLGEIIDGLQVLLIFLVEFFVFYFAIKYWSQGLITVGTFVLAQTYIIGLANQLWNVNRIIRTVYQALADSKEMVEILLTPHEIKDLSNASKLEIKNGEIEFKNVSFGFKDENKILNNLNLKIKPKEKLALVGHSGSGKTTFVRLIMRLYNINSGEILIDNQDISKVTQESLREQISFVPQDPVLFHRSLLENIRYGRRDATDEEVKEASKLAHCDEFIENLPLKYDTLVGERGIKLSGGERQRVAIARAILKKAPILIFDEATSSLDSYSESLIQDALENLMKSSTTIIIAHRLSTVKKMDRIIVMDKGEIVEDGTHEKLLDANNGNHLYKKLWDLQVGGFL